MMICTIILCAQVKLLNETIKQQDAKLQESSMIKVHMQIIRICIADKFSEGESFHRFRGFLMNCKI